MSPTGSEGSNASNDAHVGTVGLNLQLAPGVVIDTLSWEISDAATDFDKSGTVNVEGSSSAAFQVGGLPTGDGYVGTLNAVTADGTLTCSGSANFGITPGATTVVHITMYCTGAGVDAGNAAFVGTTQVCANVDSLTASPTETTVGGTISLAADASAGSIVPTYAWTATAGTFDNATSPTPVFTCPSTSGSVTITVTAAPSAAGCTTQTSQALTVTCD